MGLVILLLSYVGILTHILFVTISFAAGLYYISEIVEEYSEKCKKIIKISTISTIVVYLMLAVSESFSWTLILCGLGAQLVHLAILRNFPNIKILSLEFWSGLTLLFVNHYLAYLHFQEHFYTLTEILGYFTLCLWVVPFSLFVSLSANDNVLPSYRDSSAANDNDLVTNYFSSKRRQNLLSFFNSAKQSLLPTQTKKSF